MSIKLFFFFILAPFIIYGATISGFLRDAKNGEALAEGSIFLEGTTYGATANIHGYYAVTGLAPDTYKLKATYVGYETFEKEIKINSKYQSIKLDINLNPDALILDTTIYEVEEDTPEEVVKDFRISKLKVNPRKIKTSATFFQPDLFRTLQAMPGVASTSDYSAGLYVRGGNDDHNLILYDDITVYNPSHMFGLFSTFITDALRDTKLIKSAYSAEYGGRLGSVLDVRSLDGNRNEFEGNLSLSILASEAVVSGPVYNGGFLAAFRRTHLDPILKMLEEANDADFPSYYFWEGQGQVYQDIGDDDRIIFSTYMGTDEMNYEDVEFDLIWGNRTYSTRWRHIFSPKLFSTFRVAYSHFFIESDFSGNFKNENKVEDYSAKGTFEYFASNDMTYKFGGEVQHFSTKFESKNDDITTMDIESKSQIGSVFGEVSKTWLSVFTLKPGLRLSYNDDLSDDYKVTVSPRLSMKYMLRENHALTLSGGRYYQSLFTVQEENAPLTIVNQWFNVDDTVDPGISDNFVLGWETTQKLFDEDYTFSIEGYYKNMKNLQTWDETRATGDDVIENMRIADYFISGDAEAYGVEFYLKKNYGKLNGNISYTYGQVEKTAEFNGIKKTFPAYWDVNHSLKSSLSYNFSKKFSLGSTFTYTSGLPYSEVIGFQTIVLENGDEVVREIHGERNGKRYPDYIRLDLSANYKWFFSGNQELLLNLSVLNALNRENVQGYTYEVDDSNNMMKKETVPQLPILPSIRLSYSF